MSPRPAIRLGTQGWSYADWVGAFYPPGSRQEHFLPFYAEIFDTVELDTTFYHPPGGSVVRSWAKHTPEGFRFAAKVPQRITHESRLANMAPHLEAFARALEPLGPRLGPLLVQMPAEFVRDAGTAGILDRFLAAAPPSLRLAVEFRDRSWHARETYEILRRRRAAIAWTDWRELPRVTEVTTDFLYLRWLRGATEVPTFDRIRIDRTGELDAWARDLEIALPSVREVYGYFNNHWAGHSPASANEMKRRLGLEVVEPKERWTQRELW